MQKRIIIGYILWMSAVVGLAGCKEENRFVRQENQNGYLVTTFDVPEIQKNEEALQLSDLVKNVRVVPLEN